MSIDNFKRAQESLARYYRRRDAGLCIQCGRVKTDGTIRCTECAAAYRAWHKDRYERRKEMHLCVDCGRELDGDYTHVKCAECRQWQKYYYEKKKAEVMA